ncbi:aspartate/glutamate racemase family protein [Methylobacterium sp. J-026]|nr:aspartate/glutamate racemase family protein [Methylobacterium sp. J-026]MCJ2133755.1 aspartate/glutamate racemase family protein [Methylobacterium sp. J-026]
MVLGLADALATIRTVAPSGGAIARNPDAALAGLVDACGACVGHGAETIILGGAGPAGLAARIAQEIGIPLICSVEAGTRSVRAAGTQSVSNGAGCKPTERAGFSPAFTALVAGPCAGHAPCRNGRPPGG